MCCCHNQGEGHRCSGAWELITAAQQAYGQRRQMEVLALRRAYTQHLQAAGLLSLAGEAWPDRCTITMGGCTLSRLRERVVTWDPLHAGGGQESTRLLAFFCARQPRGEAGEGRKGTGKGRTTGKGRAWQGDGRAHGACSGGVDSVFDDMILYRIISYDVSSQLALQKDPGMILLIGGEKGGTGKTTVATNLAALRAAAGYDVLFVDTDRQGTAAAWCQLRADHPGLPPVPCVQLFGKTVQTGIRDLAHRYREILIDAGGRDAVELRSALVVAECVYIPIQPSQYDLWTLEHMQELVVAAQGFNPPLEAFVLLTRVSTHPLVADTAEAQSALDGLAPLQLARPMLAERQAWRRSARSGQAVTELARPDPKASTELRLLYGAIYHD